jgi:threonine synthase
MPADALKCKECQTSYPLDARYVCERCFGPLEVSYTPFAGDPEELRRRIQAGPQTLWRYADFLPVQAPPRAALATGCTPLVRADRLAERLGLREVWVKNETANPTHSFKDRVVSVALARAIELGFDTVACASTGNLAGAVAAHAAYAGLPAFVFVPSDLEAEKILSAGAYGAQIVGVRGNYDDVNRLCTEVSGEYDSWAFVNVNVRPYYAEGSKTLAYEIAEDLGWEIPDRIVAPVASGSLYTKVARGFQEWLDAGLLAGQVPVMNGAQAAGCAPFITGTCPASRPRAARRWPPPSGPAATSAARSSPTRSPSRWRSETPPTAPTRSSSPAARAARSTPSATTRSAPGSGCWPRRPGSSPRPPAG